MHNSKGELLTKAKIIKVPLFDFEQFCEFYKQGEVCIIAKYTILGIDENDEYEYLHMKVRQFGFDWIKHWVN